MVQEPNEMYDIISIKQKEDDLVTTPLYSIKPIANEGKNVESLSSYLVRLANAHKVSIGILTSKILMPHLKEYNFNYSTNIYRGYSRHINGLGEFSEINIEILERLTEQKNLSSLTINKFGDVINKTKLMKSQRTWCPECLQQMKEDLNVPYEKLIWNINHYDICLKHSIFLKSTCNQCGRLQNILHVNSRIGYCQYCCSWLGYKKSVDTNFISMYGDTIYNSKEIEDLVDFFFATAKISRKPFISSINFINDKLREKISLREFSLNNLEMHPGSLLRYNQGRTIPNITLLLKISRLLDIRLVEILSGEVKDISFKSLNRQSKIRYNHRVHYNALEVSLNNIIKSQGDIISITTLSKKLNVSRKTLRESFPDLINKIKKNNDKINQNVEKKMYRFYNHENDCKKVMAYLQKVLMLERVITLEQITTELKICSSTLKKYFPNLVEDIKVKNKLMAQKRGRFTSISKKYKTIEMKRVKEKLQEISNSIEEEPIYLSHIEEELGISQYRLRRKFPDLIKLISAKNKDSKQRKRRVYIDNCNQELINTIIHLISQDIYPGVDALQKHLNFKINNPVFLSVWRKTLMELGIEKKSFRK